MTNDDEFARLVAEDVKNNISPQHRKSLMQAENIPRWHEALIALKENIETQIDDIRKDELADIARYESFGRDGSIMASQARSVYKTKIAKISRFKFYVDRRIEYVAGLSSKDPNLNHQEWDQAVFLKKSISTHRSLIRKYGLEETSIDRALWASLEGIWEYDQVSENNL